MGDARQIEDMAAPENKLQKRWRLLKFSYK
jgi:hypothetical protein